MSDERRGDDVTDAEDLGQGGARCRDRATDPHLGGLALGVVAGDVVDQLERKTMPFPANSVGRFDPREEPRCL